MVSFVNYQQFSRSVHIPLFFSNLVEIHTQLPMLTPNNKEKRLSTSITHHNKYTKSYMSVQGVL